MGNFGWTGYKSNDFWILSYKKYGDKVNITHLADHIKDNAIYSKGGEGIIFYVKNGSYGDDYKKAVTALKAIRDIR